MRGAHEQGPTKRGEGSEGQAAVELALVLPLVVTVLLLIVQVGLVVRDQILVVHAAREGARQAAVDDDSDSVRDSVLEGSGLAAQRTDVSVEGRGGPGSRVRVEVRYRAPTDLPLVGGMLGDVRLTARVTMRVEQ